MNIAIYLLDYAYRDTYDKAIVISGDSDLKPAIKAVKARFPQKKIHSVFPIGRVSKDLKALSYKSNQIAEFDLAMCQLADNAEGYTVSRPKRWT